MLARWWGSLALSDWPAASTTRSARSSSSARAPAGCRAASRTFLDAYVGNGSFSKIVLCDPVHSTRPGWPRHPGLAQDLNYRLIGTCPAATTTPRHRARSTAGDQPTATRRPAAHRDQHTAARWQAR